MTEQSNAVFLSYASQDAEAAQRICEALRAAGIEVWFDQSELRGGDAWDRKIRHEINDCALFIPIVSQHTQERLEGYFRHEWKFATERTHHMADEKAFLVPVVIDSTGDREAIVPDLFRAMQWTRLPAGETPPAFVERVQRLLSPESPAATRSSTATGPAQTIGSRPRKTWWSKRALPMAVAVVIASVGGYIALDRLWLSKRAASPPSVAASTVPNAFSPPPHSIAVLPFVNMSGDREQEYFSDGLSEELLNDLARINELQVAARTSAFSFKGKDTDIGTIARRLNVGTVLEGSVRRSVHKVRVTAQLINAVNGYHLWSETYDRDLGDVLRLETEIASAVASALRITLLRDVATEINVGGTRIPAAKDAYLRAASAYWQMVSASDNETVRAGYQEAVRLDPNFALAYAEWSMALGGYASDFAHGPAIADFHRQARAQALKAIALAPELGEGHLALASVQQKAFDFAGASDEFQRAVTLSPGNARILRDYGLFAVQMGRTDAGLTAARRAVALDPLNELSYSFLDSALLYARRYDEALAVYQNWVSLGPKDPHAPLEIGAFIYYGLSQFEKMRTLCEGVGEQASKDFQSCLALAYHKLGRQADAETALARFKASKGASAYEYAEIYAQWGNTLQALRWLETAQQLRDPELIDLKIDELLDPVRNEPRFQTIERALKFPD